MKIRATVTIVAEYEVDPKDYIPSDNASILLYEERELDLFELLANPIADVKVKIEEAE